MSSLVTRFHILLLAVTVAITAVGFLRIPADFAYPAHWSRSGADWLWGRDLTLAVAPALQAVLIACFFTMGRLFSKNQFAKSQHILDPTLTLLMTVVASTQLGFLLTGIGSDLDFVRLTAFGLGGLLVLLGIILFEAERHTYAGLRMPWPIPGDAAWAIVHRATGLTFGFAGLSLLAAAWFDVGIGLLVLLFALGLGVPAFIAALATRLTKDL